MKSFVGTCNKYGNAKAQAEYLCTMKRRKIEQLAISMKNKSEQWMADLLLQHGILFSRQAIYGKRIFDFWIHDNKKALGVAIEVDGESHDYRYDEYRDRFAFARSQILVFRVKNFDETDAFRVVSEIKLVMPFDERRKILIDGPHSTTALSKNPSLAFDLWESVRCNLCSWRDGSKQPPL